MNTWRCWICDGAGVGTMPENHTDTEEHITAGLRHLEIALAEDLRVVAVLEKQIQELKSKRKK
jgi:hypothetical protein